MDLLSVRHTVILLYIAVIFLTVLVEKSATCTWQGILQMTKLLGGKTIFKPEPIMLLNLPIILSRISQKCYLLFSKSIL